MNYRNYFWRERLYIILKKKKSYYIIQRNKEEKEKSHLIRSGERPK
jgi:hypothetical protein